MHSDPLKSPVPADERLGEGEYPFTAFGQWGEGKLDLRVFDQDTWWVDRLGIPHLIEEMPKEYVHNVVSFLEKGARQFYAATLMRAIVQVTADTIYGMDILPGLNPEVLLEMTEQEWLHSTPLYLKLTLCTN